MVQQENKKSGGKGKGIFLKIIIAMFVFVVLSLIVLYVRGGTGKIDDVIPSTGIDIISIPFSANGQETIPVQWLVHGAEDEAPLISGVYFGGLPAATDLSKSPLPDQIRYEAFVPYHETTLDNGEKVLQADIPNAYDVMYLSIYAKINGQHYWSDEFIVRSK